MHLVLRRRAPQVEDDELEAARRLPGERHASREVGNDAGKHAAARVRPVYIIIS